MNLNRTYEVLNASLRRIEDRLSKQGGTDQTTVKTLIKAELKKHKGGVSKEELLVCVEEVFGKNNFKNGKYQGGKELIITTIEELFEETNKENINTIEQKLGGPQNFQDGVYKGKEIINAAVVEGLDAKGEAIILEKIHDIFGPGEFYPIKGGEGVPPGREGCRKNAEEIAMMQAQEQKKIRAIEEWDDFFDNKHFISDATQKKIWMDKFPGNPKAAEN
ncbi:4381_t:CDS:2, partial [Racocetra persica]